MGTLCTIPLPFGEAMSTIKIPSISPELVEYLRQAYPDRSPALTLSDREVWFKAGQAKLVADLRDLQHFQQHGDNTKGSLPDVLGRLPSSDHPAGPSDAGPGGSTAVRAAGSPGNRLGHDPE